MLCHALVVSLTWLRLSLSSATTTAVQPAMATMQQLVGQSPFAMASTRDEQEDRQLLLCAECTKNYDKEASLVKAEADAEGPRASLPAWLMLHGPPADQTPH